MFWYIYLWTCLKTGKQYVGQHCVKEKKEDPNYWSGYCPSAVKRNNRLIYRAIKKHGKRNFKREVLCWCTSLEEANEKEVYYIEKYDTMAPNGYNTASGGSNGNTFAGLPYSELEKHRKRCVDRFSGSKNHFSYEGKLPILSLIHI